MFEIAVGLGLTLTGVANPGSSGLNVSGFNPAHIGSSSGFFLAIVLSIFAFTGFESAAAVGEGIPCSSPWSTRDSYRLRWLS
jgi:hypothetical protein